MSTTATQNHQVVYMLCCCSLPLFMFKNCITWLEARKKVMTASASTVTVSVRRSPTIEPVTLVNEAFWRLAM